MAFVIEYTINLYAVNQTWFYQDIRLLYLYMVASGIFMGVLDRKYLIDEETGGEKN